MMGTVLLSFVGGMVTAIVLELLKLEALLAPFRSFFAVILPES